MVFSKQIDIAGDIAKLPSRADRASTQLEAEVLTICAVGASWDLQGACAQTIAGLAAIVDVTVGSTVTQATVTCQVDLKSQQTPLT